MDSDFIQKSFDLIRRNQSFAFATIVETTVQGAPRKAGAKMVVMRDGSILGTIGGGSDEEKVKKACLRAIKTGQTELVICEHFGRSGQPLCGGYAKIFIEPFIGKKNLIICGAGHIALPLSVIGKMLNYSVTVIDPRKEFANKKRFPHVDHVIDGNFKTKLNTQKIDQQTFIVIITYSHIHDFECLRGAIKSDAGYIGLIASHHKKLDFFQRLTKEGFSVKELKRISVPAGIDIGAQTPEEIAISIIAEIIKSQNLNYLGTKKFKQK